MTSPTTEAVSRLVGQAAWKREYDEEPPPIGGVQDAMVVAMGEAAISAHLSALEAEGWNLEPPPTIFGHTSWSRWARENPPKPPEPPKSVKIAMNFLPEGMVIVPAEPTRVMYDAYVTALPKPVDGKKQKCSRRQKFKLRWRATLAAHKGE